MFFQNLKPEQVKEVARRYELATSEKQFGPIDVFHLLQNRISEYIQQSQRIVYGGFALNLILKNKIYTNYERPDLEFYSPNIFADGILLVKHLKQYYKEVELVEAIHSGTIKLYVDYQQICDISYIEIELENFFKKYFVIEVEGLKCLSPEIMLIDKFRMISDPTKYNRIEKELRRTKIIFDFGVSLKVLLSSEKQITKQQSTILSLKKTESQVVIPKKLLLQQSQKQVLKKDESQQNLSIVLQYLKEQLIQNKEIHNFLFCDGASLKSLFPNYELGHTRYALIISPNIDKIFNYVILILKSKGIETLQQLQFGKFQEFFDRFMILILKPKNHDEEIKILLIQPPHTQCYNYFNSDVRSGIGDRQLVLTNYRIATAETQLAIKTYAIMYFQFRMFLFGDDLLEEIQEFQQEIIFLLNKAGEKNSFSQNFIGEIPNMKLERKLRQQQTRLTNGIAPFEYNPEKFNPRLIDKYIHHKFEQRIGTMLSCDTIVL